MFLQKLFSCTTLSESQVLGPIFLPIGLDISLVKFLRFLMTAAIVMVLAAFVHAFCEMVKVGVSALSSPIHLG